MRGQWYIIASILISFSLISFFYIYDSYSKIDFTSIAENNIDNYVSNLVYALNETKLNSHINENVLGDKGDLLDMFKNALIEQGYFVKYNYTTSKTEFEIIGNNVKVKISS